MLQVTIRGEQLKCRQGVELSNSLMQAEWIKLDLHAHRRSYPFVVLASTKRNSPVEGLGFHCCKDCKVVSSLHWLSETLSPLWWKILEFLPINMWSCVFILTQKIISIITSSYFLLKTIGCWWPTSTTLTNHITDTCKARISPFWETGRGFSWQRDNTHIVYFVKLGFLPSANRLHGYLTYDSTNLNITLASCFTL